MAANVGTRVPSAARGRARPKGQENKGNRREPQAMAGQTSELAHLR